MIVQHGIEKTAESNETQEHNRTETPDDSRPSTVQRPSS